MKALLTIAALMAVSGAAMAKSAMPDVSGKILDEYGEPMPFANVVLLSEADSSFIQGATTDEDGSFSIQAPAGKSILRISSVGYETYYQNIGDKLHNECNIHLQVSASQLDAVEVNAQLPKTKLTARGMQTALKGSVLEKVGSAEDALARIPGMMKTGNGLEVIGKGAPLYYINGRKVRDLKELKLLRSDEIQDVEVISNPGAQYDATVSAVVRIKTIRHQGDGFGFNTGVTDAQSLRIASNNDPNAYLNMNWRRGDVDIFGGGSFDRTRYRQTSDMEQRTYGTPGFAQVGTLDYRSDYMTADFNLGANWQISDQQSVGVRVDKSHSGRQRIRQTIFEDIYRNDVLEDQIVAIGHHDPEEDPNSMKVNTYYNGMAGKMGIDLNADYYLVNGSQIACTDEESLHEAPATVTTVNHSKNQLWAAKLVLSYPLWKGQLEMGTEETFSRREEDYWVANTSTSGTSTSQYIPSTDSEVEEDNYAAFVEYGFSLPKVGQLSAGLRYEHVDYRYLGHNELDNKVDHENIDRVDDNFFPSFSWTNAYTLRDGSPLQLSASYSMATIRPDFYRLNSAIRYHSRFTWQSGNAKLKNQINHEAALSARWKVLMFNAFYYCQRDAISQWSSIFNDEGVVLVKACNLASPVHKASYYLTASPTWGCWTLKYTVGMQQQWLKIDAVDKRQTSGMRTLCFDDQQFVAQMFNVWRLGGKQDGTNQWQFELSGTLMTKGYQMNTKQTNNYCDVSLGVQKSWLKNDALTLRLQLDDALQLADWDVATDCGSHLVRQTNQFDYHRLTFKATYAFNAARSKYRGTGAGQDVKRRMGK